MKNDIMVKRTIPEVIKAINNAEDIKTITWYEDLMVCMFLSPLMFIAAFLNLSIRYGINNIRFQRVVDDTIIFIVLGISFELVSRLKLKKKILTHLVSLLFSILALFLSVQFGRWMGPAVWGIFYLQLILSLVRITKNMLAYTAITGIVIAINNIYFLGKREFTATIQYYLIHSILIFICFAISFIVHKINTNRYKKVDEQLKNTIYQKEEITSLYEEIAATEEELRDQHNRLIVYSEDIKRNEEKLNYLSYFDTLTELPNRKMIIDRVNLMINLSNKMEMQFFIVFIDIDGFKRINDTLGHQFGDRVLISAARQIKESINANDLLGRLGGDEFALVIQQELKEEDIFEYTEKIRVALSRTFQIDDNEVNITASFGVAVFPQDGNETVELMKAADTSMYKAKELGKNNIQFFNKKMEEEIIQKIRMEGLLEAAYQKGEFHLVYQPQYNLGSNNLRGFEALLRWNSKELGLMSPQDFIPICEETGLILKLGKWVLQTACERFKEIQEEYKLDLCISVNVSAVQIMDRNFIGTIRKILDNTGLKPEFLELEITESMLIDDIDQAISLLQELRALGIKIALDDFGTGYSSLSYLRRLPINTLKIDKSFINDLDCDITGRQIVGDIISLAHRLGLYIVAEGVENNKQSQYLYSNNCDFIQGYLYGRPMETSELKVYLTEKLN